MMDRPPAGSLPSIVTAALVCVPFWLLAVLGYPLSAAASPHSNFVFGIAYALLLAPGYFLAWVCFSEPGHGYPWYFVLPTILAGQYLAIFLLLSLYRAVRRRHSPFGQPRKRSAPERQ